MDRESPSSSVVAGKKKHILVEMQNCKTTLTVPSKPLNMIKLKISAAAGASVSLAGSEGAIKECPLCYCEEAPDQVRNC